MPERKQPGNGVAGSGWVSLLGAEHLHDLDPHDYTENGRAERQARARLIELCAQILEEAGIEDPTDQWAVEEPPYAAAFGVEEPPYAAT